MFTNFIRYFFWLLKEIIKSAWDITKVVLSPNLEINPHLIEFDLDHGSDVAAIMLANYNRFNHGFLFIQKDNGTS